MALSRSPNPQDVDFRGFAGAVSHLLKCNMSDLPPIMTRAQAKAAGLSRYFSGEPCVNGHVCERNVSDAHCMDCNRDRDAARYPDRRDAQNAYHKARWPDRRDADNARRREQLGLVNGPRMPTKSRRLKDAAIAAGLTRYFDGVPCVHGHIAERTVSKGGCCECKRLSGLEYSRRAEVRAAMSARRDTPVGRKKARQHSINWMRANPEKRRAIYDERVALLTRATPGWVDWDAIEQVYQESSRLTADTGVLHHVDHVIPLKGKTVCGLHVHNNLRAVPADVNRRKANKLLED
jgi:hypothetical protein